MDPKIKKELLLKKLPTFFEKLEILKETLIKHDTQYVRTYGEALERLLKWIQK